MSNVTNDAQVKKISSSSNNNVAVWNGTTGDMLSDSGKQLPVGTIVGTNDNQVLINKILKSPNETKSISVDDNGAYAPNPTLGSNDTQIATTSFVNSTILPQLQVLTTNTILNSSHNIILVNSTTPTTITLPSATDKKQYTIKNINTGSVTIMPNGSDTIDGQVSLAISTQYTSYTIISNGDCWYII